MEPKLDHTSCAGTGQQSPQQSSVGCAQSTTDPTIGGQSRREDDIALLARIVADALKDNVVELRKGDEARMSQFTTTFQGELSAFRKSEENRIARLEKAITGLKSPSIGVDPTTNFWTVYKKVADEYDNDLVSQYTGDLDTSLLFAGLFSAVTTTIIAQLIPQIQPNPVDLTNVLLLRILQQNTSFGGTDPLAPASSIPTSVITAQSILFASLSVTLFVAFIAMLGKQWILYYTRASTWGNIVDRGKERQAKLVGLQKWGFHAIMESLPVLLQIALLLFGAALVVYLWGLDVSAADAVLVTVSIGCVFYACIAVAATVWGDFPFQTPLSVLLSKVLPWAREFTALARVWLRHWARRRVAALLLRVERGKGHAYIARFLGRLCKIFIEDSETPDRAAEDTSGKHYPMTLSNPAFWRNDPLFVPLIPKDFSSASAGLWLLKNSTDFSAASAVAAVFSEFQWPSHYHSTTALIRLRDTYMQCLRESRFDELARLKALQSAAAYYVLYHTQLIWGISKGFEVIGKLPPELLPDLFLHEHSGEWDGDDVFEYLLHKDRSDRSEPVMSARFLSYIAPYWFCGDSDSSIRFRPTRLQTLRELIEVLEKSRALNSGTLTDCVLCIGAAMDFPLHPEDLIWVDKSDYLASTFKMVVEHIHRVILVHGHPRRHTRRALEIILVLVEKATLPLVDAAWINELLKSASGGGMDDGEFALFLRLSARKKEEDATADADAPDDQGHVRVRGSETDPQGAVTPEPQTPEETTFSAIMRNVKACSEQEGWQDEAVYGGLIAIRDIPRLGSCLPEVGFLETLSDAMEETKPFRVRKAAYDVVSVARHGWLRSTELREKLMELDFPRRLHSVVTETRRSDHQLSFLKMTEILSEDKDWHSYLRGAMDIWLPFRHEGSHQALRIFCNICQLSLPEYDGHNPPLDKLLEKLVEDDWGRVPGRHAKDLSANLLQPLAEVTKQLKDLLFGESDREAVLDMVKRVIPSLEKRRDDGYEGPGEDIREIINDLLERLRVPMQSTSRRSTDL